MRNGVWVLALRGLAAITFGVIAVVWPAVTAITLSVLFGLYALVNGVLHIMAGLSRHRTRELRSLFLLTGLIGLVIALVALAWPKVTALALAVLIGIWAIVVGILDIWAATRWRAARLLAVVGVVSVLAGLLILIRPALGAVFIAEVIGIYAIVAGVVMVATARQRRRAPNTATRATR
jgi:uncharacterized membrane protein HdeD (DUF308 family)